MFPGHHLRRPDPFQRENLFIWKGSLLTHSTEGARLVGIGKGEDRAKEIVGLSFFPKKQRREMARQGQTSPLRAKQLEVDIPT